MTSSELTPQATKKASFEKAFLPQTPRSTATLVMIFDPKTLLPIPNLVGPTLLIVAGTLLVGCPSETRTAAPSGKALTDSLAEGYQWLERQYEKMGESMPRGMRGMQGRMQAMHGQMMDGRESMMERRERGEMMGRMKKKMGRGGMMGGKKKERSQVPSDGRGRMGHRHMGAMHETMARMHEERHPRMAARHRKMARWHGKMRGHRSDGLPQSTREYTQTSEDAVPSGAALFDRQCASCHGPNGQGVGGTFPPLAGSKWVTGDVSVPARIVLHGLEGPIAIDGRQYDGVMPAFGDQLSDAEIASLLTYLRTSLNETEDAVKSKAVSRIRDAYADRRQAWTAEELRTDRTPSSTNREEN